MLFVNLYRKEHHERGARGRWLRALQEGQYYKFSTDEYATMGYWVYNPFSQETYQVSLAHCSCPDGEYNTAKVGSCKHRQALALRLMQGTLFESEEI